MYSVNFQPPKFQSKEEFAPVTSSSAVADKPAGRTASRQTAKF